MNLTDFEMSLFEPPNPVEGNCASTRERFQWNAMALSKGPVLNVGSCDDPMGFAHRAVHYDLDDWSEYYERKSLDTGLIHPFIQGDAHKVHLKFGVGLFDLVVMGDIIEHLYDPIRAVQSAAAVSKRLLAMTIWEEWRVPPGEGAGIQMLEDEAHEKGFGSYLDLYVDMQKGRGVVPVDNRIIPHHGHLYNFTDDQINALVGALIDMGMVKHAFVKVPETIHEGHVCMNWCVLLSWERELPCRL